ncbi:hypothetical protein B0A49_04907 [Cryomyces minteri]|uniref:Uncharacterized protein n=1 Tax=Cryomyces minteri TaxID=331657 RepID=A0A4U0XVE2_9PEZI|nr:hypothetical protein B0A49_04907 [Cryomyces minteri]
MADSDAEPDRDEFHFTQKQAHYRGRAKVKLLHLAFEGEHVPGSRWVDEKNVQRLVQVFETEGCYRLEPEHFVPALVRQADLDHALAASGLTQAELLDCGTIPPTLSLPSQCSLLCLHGRHRVEAAHRHLGAFEKWWVVDLYIDDLPHDTITVLRTEYSNARAFCDGDVFRNLRFHQQRGDLAQAGKWLARLSSSKQRDVRKLLTKKDRLRKAFDDLLPFIGLWAPLQLGTFHRILTLNCDEELVHYLHHIQRTWSRILGSDESLRSLLDANTVYSLQLLAPRHSLRDDDEIRSRMEDGRLFPTVTDRAVRAKLLHNTQQVEGRIPSLHTFFEDTKYLEPCAKVVKALLPPGLKGSVRKAIEQRYTGRDQTPGYTTVQIDEHTNERVAAAEERSNVELGYRQLWPFAMRHFPQLSGINPRKDAGRPKPNVELRLELLPRFAKLACFLGVDSPEIAKMQSRDPVDSMVQEFLRKARPPDLYANDPSSFDGDVEQICAIVKRTHPRPLDHAPPATTDDVTPQPLLHRPSTATRPMKFRSDTSSSFGVKQDVFFAFFGRPSGIFDAGLAKRPQETLEVASPDSSDPWATAKSNLQYGSGEHHGRSDHEEQEQREQRTGSSPVFVPGESGAQVLSPATDQQPFSGITRNSQRHDEVIRGCIPPDADERTLTTLLRTPRSRPVILYFYETGFYLLAAEHSRLLQEQIADYANKHWFAIVFERARSFRHVRIGEELREVASHANLILVGQKEEHRRVNGNNDALSDSTIRAVLYLARMFLPTTETAAEFTSLSTQRVPPGSSRARTDLLSDILGTWPFSLAPTKVQQLLEAETG